MEPKDMDRQIAKIMGWGCVPSMGSYHIIGEDWERLMGDWKPSTNIAHAREAANELSRQGYRTRITLIEHDLGCEVTIFKPGIGKESKHHLQDEICTVYDSSEAMAISLAIIAAKELE